MGKQEIIDFLKKCRNKGIGKQTAKDITEELGISPSTTSILLEKLRRHNDIRYIEEKLQGRNFRYRYWID